MNPILWPFRKTRPHPAAASGLARTVALLLTLMGLCAWSGEAAAIAKFARTTGTWTTAGIWSNVSCATAGATTVPTAADDVTICSGVTVTMAGNPGAALSMTINGTATWTLARTTNVGAGGVVINGDITGAANGVLTVTGGLTLNGVTLTSNTVTVTRQTTAAQTISGTGSLARLAINATTTNNATLTVRTALTGTSTLTNAAGQTLNIGGTSTITTLTATAANNVVNYYANAAQTVKATTYYHLTKSGTGTATAGGNLTVNGTLTVSAGTLALAATTSQINGPTDVTGTLSMTTATKTFVGAVTVNAGGVWTSSATGTSIFRGGITHNGTTFTAGIGQFNTSSQALAGSSAMTFAGAVTVTGAITVTNSNTNTVRIDGNLNGSVAGSTFINGANATLDYRGANVPMTTGVLTANASPNTVNYNRVGNQTVKLPSAGYYHLTLSDSATKTAPAGTLTVLGNLTVNAGPTFTANTNDPTINVTGNVTVAGTYQSSSTAAALTIGGNLGVSGTYTGNGGPANLAGNFTNSGTFASGAGVFTFNGSALQTLTGATTFTSMTVNNTGTGLSLANDITATTAAAGTLVLTAGAVTTGSNNLIVPRSCTVPSVTRTGGWVAGNLRLAFPTGTPTCTFHVGDASNYRPIDMTFASVTGAGSLTGTVSQSAGEHPNIATSGLDSAADVNRYWTLTKPAAGAVAFTTYTATFNFINPGDFDVGANPTYFEIERWDGSAWNTTTLGTAGSTSTSASGLPSFGAGVSHSFAVGQKKAPTVVSINLASLDPATSGTSVDWAVTFSANVTGVDTTDFTLVMGGGLSGATITGVLGSGTTWTVTADTGSGGGTLGLNLVDDDTIINVSGTPLGGAGAGNGDFTGQVYTVQSTSFGFIFTDSPCVHNIALGALGQTCVLISWSPQVAGQNLTGVYITRVNTSGVPLRFSIALPTTRNIQFGLSCHDPVANAGVQATFAGVTLPLCQASGATPTTWSSTVAVTFLAGSPSSNVSYTFNYADVGSVELWMRNSATPSQTGSSGTFVVKPYGFTVTGIKRTSDSVANPAAADATGAAFIKAGASFTATVTATASGGAATPNYGKEQILESVRLTPTLVLPSGGNNPLVRTDRGTTTSGSNLMVVADSSAYAVGDRVLVVGAGSGGATLVSRVQAIPNSTTVTLADNALTDVINAPVQRLFRSFSSGSATTTDLVWDEVGIITLTPSVGDGNYLGAGDVTGTTTGNVGRFFPYQFTLSSPSLTPAASTFSYMDQPFAIDFTLTAQNAGGTTTQTTQNYAGNFAKLDHTDTALWPSTTLGSTGFALGARDGTTDLSTRLSVSGTPTGTWTIGEVTVSAQIKFARPTTSTSDATWGSYESLDIGVAPRDSDGVVLAGAALDMDANNDSTNERKKLGQDKARFGRLRLLSFYGSELLKPRVEYRTEYWDGSRWTTNAADSTTSITTGNIAGGGLTANSVTLTDGIGYITFNTAGTGGYDIAVNLGTSGLDTSCNASHGGTAASKPWLKGFWSAPANCGSVAAWAQDPSARIRLGSHKAPYIYLRERY